MKQAWLLTALLLFILGGVFNIQAQTKKVKESFKVLDDGTVHIQNEAVQDENCLFGSDGEIDISVYGGVSPYTYEWTDGIGTVVATTQDLIGVVAGDYSVTVTDNTGCSSSANFTLGYFCPYTCSGLLEVTTIDPSSCQASDGEINATLLEPGPYVYNLYRYDQYNNSYTLIDNGSSVGATFNRLFTNLPPGRYELEVTAAGPCTYTTSADLAGTDFYLTGSSSTNNTSCVTPNGSITVDILDTTLPHNFQVRWKNIYTGAEDSQLENSTTITISNLVAGYYVVEVRDLDTGCMIQHGLFVNSSAPFLTVTTNSIVPQSTCTPPNGSISIDVTGGSGSYTFTWFTPSGVQSTKDITNLTAGSHFLYVNDLVSGCTNDVASNTFTVANTAVTPSAIYVVTPNTSCTGNNGAIDLTPIGIGPFTITWYNEMLDPIAGTEDLINVAPGIYGVRITDQSNGCSRFLFPGDGSPEVTDHSLPAISLTSQVFNSTDCNGIPGNGAIDLTVTTAAPTVTYLWNGPFGFTSPDEDIANLPAGDYTVTVEVTCIANTPPVITPDPLSATSGQTLIDLDLLAIITDAENNFVIDSLKIIRQPVSGAFAELIKTPTTASLRIDYSGISYLGIDSVRIEACDALGACSQQEIFITVEVTSSIVIYNAVSPVGAPGNQYLRIDGLPQSANRVSIYNRWGDLVFSINDYDNLTRRFEGISNSGKDLPSGTYFYKIEISGGPVVTGFLSLKR
ncbi:MAG: gliding motility-associated C-terminal domain-containing protein [Flammeovirgaceae bacterium]|nr:MAG: gliding motility-associated C-terminal domain-containing protein [Flammeovirgaceae bacterium]